MHIDEHKRAYAVEFMRRGKLRIVHANKEIIVSGGAINTPQILMLSGIGPATHLKSHGVSPSANLNNS